VVINARSKPKRVEIVAVVRRADGTVENLGAVAYWHRNPLRRLAWRVKHWRA